MKVIKYQICTKAEDAEILSAVTLSWNEVNEELAKNEAYNGAYTIEDDGLPEPEASTEQRISELEEALNLLLSGVTE
jgi:hypothetical protein